jgi:probable rRNA maturation factor
MTAAAEQDRGRVVYRPPWRIEITRRAGVASVLPDRHLVDAIDRALDSAGAPRPAAIGLILTGDAEIAALNHTHMGHRGPTDVLSFPLLPASAFPRHSGQPRATDRDPGQETREAAFARPPGRRVHLGEIVVSVERACEQAEAGRGGQTGTVRWSAQDELRLLVTHGVLHLCGWDHADSSEEAAMRSIESRLLPP